MAVIDISKNPTKLISNNTNNNNSGRIMELDKDDDDENFGNFNNRRLLKMVLKDELGNLIVALEHEQTSVPINSNNIKEGDWFYLNKSKIKLFRNFAFLLNGALTNV